MDLNKVTYLLALADTKNYSRAAEQCHISQPALTRYIKNLEEELNVTLFDRSSFPIRLTYAGERYIDGLLKILEMKEKLDKEMREIAGHVQDHISIGMHSTRCYSWLPRILPDYQKICPKVKVKLSEGNSAKLQKDVKNGAIDVFFICSMRIFPVLPYFHFFEEFFAIKASIIYNKNNVNLSFLFICSLFCN